MSKSRSGKFLSSDELDVIPCWAPDSLWESAGCGSPNIVLLRTAVVGVKISVLGVVRGLLKECRAANEQFLHAIVSVWPVA